MSAEIIPFPVRKRERWAARQREISERFPRRSREWLESKVRAYQESLTEIGVDPQLVKREVRDLEAMLIPCADTETKAQA